MRPINIFSLVSSHRKLSSSVFQSYIKHFGIKIKTDEIEDLEIMIRLMIKKYKDLDMLSNFYVGYTINQIGKEFDLLRFGDNNIINIELKRESSEDKILAQLKKNNYYLEFLGKKIKHYTFVSSEEKLYFLSKDFNLEEVSIEVLLEDLIEQKTVDIQDVNLLFDPSNYLVSPFNSTNAFLEGKYFLTEHQVSIKNSIVKLSNGLSPSYVMVEGNAGTGKTLLIYDIAKDYISLEKDVLILHCGSLNDGHKKLKNDYGWKIIQSMSHAPYNFNDYELIIFDEIQRVPKEGRNGIKTLLEKTEQTNAKYIFSFDPMQTLSSQEIQNNIPMHIKESIDTKHFKLTEKIRTNKEIASFIKNLFNLENKSKIKQKYPNVELSYFTKSTPIKKQLSSLSDQGWKVINFTPSNYHYYPYDDYIKPNSESAHNVVGQEYDKVVAVIDKHFYYDSTHSLSTKGYSKTPYYHPTKMLFQIVTRARKKLHLVILDNPKVLEECLNILE
ncbi:DUF2075 domain-containing protein (plasmid) [Rossellomorea marisflavi]|nr:DUF2075 domain-containing protein [Rossellomorea marisflavi]